MLPGVSEAQPDRIWFGSGGCVEKQDDGTSAVFVRGELLGVFGDDDVASRDVLIAVVLQHVLLSGRTCVGSAYVARTRFTGRVHSLPEPPRPLDWCRPPPRHRPSSWLGRDGTAGYRLLLSRTLAGRTLASGENHLRHSRHGRFLAAMAAIVACQLPRYLAAACPAPPRRPLHRARVRWVTSREQSRVTSGER